MSSLRLKTCTFERFQGFRFKLQFDGGGNGVGGGDDYGGGGGGGGDGRGNGGVVGRSNVVLITIVDCTGP